MAARGGESMALIQCPECKGTVSDQAETCPNCGYRLARRSGPAPAQAPQARSEGCFLQTMNVGCMIMFAIIGIIVLFIIFASFSR